MYFKIVKSTNLYITIIIYIYIYIYIFNTMHMENLQ